MASSCEIEERLFFGLSDMWGAFVFLMLFLVIDPTTREIILTAVEHARLRLAVEAPLSYVMVIILAGSAIVSALIMAYWPRTEEEPKQFHVTRRYFGPADSDWTRPPAPPAPKLQFTRYGLWLRLATAAWGKRLWAFAGLSNQKRPV